MDNEKAWTSAPTVDEVIRLHPPTLPVFNSFGIDTCCGGALSLPQAALRAGVDVRALRTALGEVIASTVASS